MVQFIWLVGSLTPLGDWSSVLMECGAESAINLTTGVLTMLELYVDNLDFLIRVIYTFWLMQLELLLPRFLYS